MSDFNYVPSYQTDGSDQFSELEAKFGDGYRQVSPDGINPVAERWNLVFDTVPTATAEAIRTFLRSHAGQSFTWTNPSSVEKRYIRTGEVSFVPAGPGHYSLRFTIEEFFGS